MCAYYKTHCPSRVPMLFAPRPESTDPFHWAHVPPTPRFSSKSGDSSKRNLGEKLVCISDGDLISGERCSRNPIAPADIAFDDRHVTARVANDDGSPARHRLQRRLVRRGPLGYKGCELVRRRLALRASTRKARSSIQSTGARHQRHQDKGARLILTGAGALSAVKPPPSCHQWNEADHGTA